MRPQCRGEYFKEENGVLCSCAIGAMAEGAGLTPPIRGHGEISDFFDATWPEISDGLWKEIVELNDNDKMSREDIAHHLAAKGL